MVDLSAISIRKQSVLNHFILIIYDLSKLWISSMTQKNLENYNSDCSVVVDFRNIPMVKCKWKVLSLSKSWIGFYALAIQDSIPILRYARIKLLLDQHPILPLLKYHTGYTPDQLACVLKTKPISTLAKHKFGIQVSYGLKQAYKMDQMNGSTLWAGAIKTEPNKLHKDQTF